jgi:integrase
MSDSNSSDPATPNKPSKPHPDFPLFPHAAGVWAKKIRGKLHYFGPWSDPDAALKKYLEQKDDLHAGREARQDAKALTVKELVNQFLNAKKALRESGELTNRTWMNYKYACDVLVDHLKRGRLVSDLGPTDFGALRNKLAKKWGPATLGQVIQHMRVVFKFAWDSDLIDRPVRYGQGFKRPSRKVMRIDRARKGPKLFTAEEIHRMLPEARTQLRAMILLGINCGYGNADCGNLPLSAINLETGWTDYPRPKTGIARRCLLWPETIQAIKEALAKRPCPKKEEDAGMVFLTAYGRRWARDTTDQALAKEFGSLLRSLKLDGRKGRGFYTLRHTFRTVADESKDQPAVDFIMGHEVPHMSAVYRETISDARLRAVTDHVHDWLFPSQAQGRIE